MFLCVRLLFGYCKIDVHRAGRLFALNVISWHTWNRSNDLPIWTTNDFQEASTRILIWKFEFVVLCVSLSFCQPSPFGSQSTFEFSMVLTLFARFICWLHKKNYLNFVVYEIDAFDVTREHRIHMVLCLERAFVIWTVLQKGLISQYRFVRKCHTTNGISTNNKPKKKRKKRHQKYFHSLLVACIRFLPRRTSIFDSPVLPSNVMLFLHCHLYQQTIFRVHVCAFMKLI